MRHVHPFLPFSAFSDRGFNATSRLDWGAVLTIKSRPCNRAVGQLRCSGAHGERFVAVRARHQLLPNRLQTLAIRHNSTRMLYRKANCRHSHTQVKSNPTDSRRHPAHPVPAPCHRGSCHRGGLHVDGRERRRGPLAVRPHAAVVRRAVQIGHDRAVLLVVARGVVVGIDRRVGEGA